ncbi:MAG TPA: outer membrane beta-barrel protein [Planctomycetaceae bacterium]|nr:outer membrane beta-barrel protein [Planctomycetaceae bacterium]
MQNRWSCLVIALAAVIPVFSHAQNTMFEPERVGNWYLSAAAGQFKEKSGSKIDLDGLFGAAISAGFRATPHVALEIEGLFASQRVETSSTIAGVALGSANGQGNISSRGVGGLVKFILPLNRVELYVGGGLGIYNTTFWTDAGFQTLVGADLFVSRHFSVGVEYRRLKFDAVLGSVVHDLDLGGDMLLATVRGHF